LWESGAIILYLIEQYDSSQKLSFSTLIEKSLCRQWLAFHISGQGPYFGQAAWFNVLHAERLPSAIARYNAELKRVLGVLETSLAGKEWLVGDKFTFADLAFAPWNDRIDMVIMCKREQMFDGFPNVKVWHERMTSRPSWIKIMEKRDVFMDEQGLQPNGIPKGIASFEEYEKLIAAKYAGPQTAQ
jgi:glutathione S-transferase